MSDLGNTFKAWKDHKQEKRLSNAEQGMAQLDREGIEYKVLSVNPYHLRVGEFDYWPSTGKFISLSTLGVNGRGVWNLIKRLKKNESQRL